MDAELGESGADSHASASSGNGGGGGTSSEHDDSGDAGADGLAADDPPKTKGLSASKLSWQHDVMCLGRLINNLSHRLVRVQLRFVPTVDVIARVASVPRVAGVLVKAARDVACRRREQQCIRACD